MRDIERSLSGSDVKLAVEINSPMRALARNHTRVVSFRAMKTTPPISRRSLLALPLALAAIERVRDKRRKCPVGFGAVFGSRGVHARPARHGDRCRENGL